MKVGDCNMQLLEQQYNKQRKVKLWVTGLSMIECFADIVDANLGLRLLRNIYLYVRLKLNENI